MDVFVLSSDYEGNPASVMEAMASVCLREHAVGGVPNLIESGKERSYRAAGCSGSFHAMASLLRNREASIVGMTAATPGKENYDVPRMVQALTRNCTKISLIIVSSGRRKRTRESAPSGRRRRGANRECEKQYDKGPARHHNPRPAGPNHALPSRFGDG